MTKLYPLPCLKVHSSRDEKRQMARTRKRSRIPLEKVVAMGASAGGINAVCSVLKTLPEAWPTAVLLVQHLLEGRKTHLPEILGRNTRLDVCGALEGMSLEAGVVYVAAPGKHLLIRDNRLVLGNGLPVRHVKPSVDVLFESVAAAWGPSIIGVVLSGTGSDGAAGCGAIKAAGGVTMAQDPRTADFSGMPEAAVKTGWVDYVLPLEEIGLKIVALAAPGGSGMKSSNDNPIANQQSTIANPKGG